MDRKALGELIVQIENYLECWKQLNGFVSLARTKKFGQEEEGQFLELKSVLTQQLEIIMAAVESSPQNKEEIYSLVSGAPSLRYLSEQGDAQLRTFENQWHKIFINFQSMLGQLKVRQRAEESRTFWSSLFGKKEGK
jgi:hypothetical protein